MTTPTADLWHHYGRTRHATDRAVPDRFSWSWSWSWSQDSGPGAAVLGARTPDGEVAGMRRWVLQEQVWPNPSTRRASPDQHADAARRDRTARRRRTPGDRVPHGPVRRVAPRCGHWQNGHACYGSQ